MTTLPKPERPAFVPPPMELPSAREMAERKITFEPVAPGTFASPVRLRQNGICAGIFTTPQAAAGTIKRVLVPCLLLFLVLAQAPTVMVAAPGIDDRFNVRMLVAIAQVEDWRGRPGKAGEIGPWQMLPAVRLDRLLEMDVGTWTDRNIARAHLVWIERELGRRGVAVVPFNVALVWNAGLERTVTGRAPVKSYDYARRVCAAFLNPK